MIFNFAVYFTLTSKIAATSSSFESSAPSYRPLPFPNHHQHDHDLNINPTIESKSEMIAAASYQPKEQPKEEPPSVQRPDSESKREKYIALPNQDIFGRCDLGNRPVLIAEAEESCDDDPMCKAFVEVDGQAYLKSCADPDASTREGRTLHVHHSYYDDAADSHETPNLRKPLPRIDPTDVPSPKRTSKIIEKNNPPPPPPRRDTPVPIHIDGGHQKYPCDVPCFNGKKSGGLVVKRRIDELDATVTYSMEGEMYYTDMKLSNRKPPKHYIASTRFDSDIPMPYFNWSWTLYLDDKPHNGKNVWSENNIQTPHVPFSKVKKAAVFIARNCNSKSKREDLVKSLMNKMTVDSVSSCLHNFDIDDKKNKVKMMRQYVVFEREALKSYPSNTSIITSVVCITP